MYKDSKEEKHLVINKTKHKRTKHILAEGPEERHRCEEEWEGEEGKVIEEGTNGGRKRQAHGC